MWQSGVGQSPYLLSCSLVISVSRLIKHHILRVEISRYIHIDLGDSQNKGRELLCLSLDVFVVDVYFPRNGFVKMDPLRPISFSIRIDFNYFSKFSSKTEDFVSTFLKSYL